MQKQVNVSPGNKPWWLVVAALGIMAIFFSEVLLRRGAYYPGDIARLYLPQREILTRALERGSLPWWSSQMGAGYPLLAEGETGALYPPNLVLSQVAPPACALSLGIVLHYLIMALGFVCFLRLSGILPGPAMIGSVALTLGGFSVAHLSHPSMLAVTSWMPWLFTLARGVIASPETRRARWFAGGLTMVVGLQFLAGHAQMSLLVLLPLSAYSLLLPWLLHQPARPARTALWAAAILTGTLIASPQLLASAELASLSQRAGGLTGAFFTSYSFHPLLGATLISPFALGNPYPEGTVEFMTYMGLLPLMLAWLALMRRERQVPEPGQSRPGRRETWFFAGLAALGFALSLGRWNPLYALLQHVPVLNLFRVPARYLVWTSFGIAVLAAFGVNTLVRMPDGSMSRWGWFAAALLGTTLVGIVSLMSVQPDLDRLVAVWRWLPLPLGVVSATAVVLACSCLRKSRTPLLLAVLCVDLYAYGLVLDWTYNATWPLEEIQSAPVSLRFFEAQPGLYRIYTKEDILPALTVARESHYPNMAAGQGLAGANLYTPLVPRSYGDYVAGLSAERLNRLSVRYYLIPQLLPVDQESELYDVLNPYASLPFDIRLELPPLRVTGIEIESYLSHAADVGDGEVVALIELGGGPEPLTLPLRAGLDTAEWAYERDDVREVIAHPKPDVASTWPASSGFPPREHLGHTYRTVLALPSPRVIEAVRLRPQRPAAFVRVERIWLHSDAGERVLLNHQVGLGSHSIVYRSEDVLVYRNEDALPRVYALAEWRVRLGSEGITTPDVLRPDQVISANMVEHSDASIEVDVQVDQKSYLILADLYYPGWYATVNGQPAEILRADGVFRAVPLDPGRHHVNFGYLPPHHPARLLRGRLPG